MSQLEIDFDARQIALELFAENTGLAGWAVGRMINLCSPHYTAEEMRQDALLALWRAATRFDPSRGYQFSTFAGHVISRAIFREWGERNERAGRRREVPLAFDRADPRASRPIEDAEQADRLFAVRQTMDADEFAESLNYVARAPERRHRIARRRREMAEQAIGRVRQIFAIA